MNDPLLEHSSGAYLIPARSEVRYHARPVGEDRSGDSETFYVPRFVWRAVMQWWPWALPASILLTTMVAVLLLVFFHPQYRAAAVLQISERVPYLAYETYEPPGKSEEFVETQIELLRSPWVLEAAAKNEQLAELPEIKDNSNAMRYLAKGVKVTRVGHSELYSVSFDGEHPGHAALIINTLVDQYFKLRAQDDASRTLRVIELLEQEKGARAQEVQRLRESMRNLTKEISGRAPLPSTSPEAPARDRPHPLDSLEVRLTEAEVNRRMLEAETNALAEIVEQQKVVVPDVTVEIAVGESDSVRNLRSLIATKTATLHRVELAAAKGKNDSSYQRLAREIKDLERQLDSTVAATRGVVEQQVKSFAALERKDELEKLKVKLENARVLENMLRERHKEQIQSLEQTGSKSLELEFTRAELELEKKVFEMIAERSMALHTEMRAPGRVALLEKADAPLEPLERLPFRELVLGGFASFCLPFLLAIAWEFSVRRISDVNQLSPLVDSSILAEIAKLPKPHRGLSPSPQRERNIKLFEESINNLRVSLVLPEYRQDVKVFAVASAIHSEGKTSVASQLAVSIARASGETALLIDGDMRSPDLHRIFDVPKEPGLSRVLDQSCTLDDAIVTTWSNYLHILPAGKLHRSPHKLLGNAAFAELIQQLKFKYRYIVIDTPPILSAAEALILAKAADGVLLCTRRNYSREHQVRMAHQRLLASGAKLLGAVFSGVPATRYAYTYGEYSYSESPDL